MVHIASSFAQNLKRRQKSWAPAHLEIKAPERAPERISTVRNDYATDAIAAGLPSCLNKR
jgi:hypothetical protein